MTAQVKWDKSYKMNKSVTNSDFDKRFSAKMVHMNLILTVI